MSAGEPQRSRCRRPTTDTEGRLHRKKDVMSQQIIKDNGIEALKVGASWPGADRATLVTLATVLAATGADHDGLSYFAALAASQPDQVLPLTLAGYFGVRAGEDIPAG